MRLRTLFVSLTYVAGTSLPRTRPPERTSASESRSLSVVYILHDAAGRLRPEREAIFQTGLTATS